MVNPLDAETCHFHRAESQVLQTEAHKDPVAVECHSIIWIQIAEAALHFDF